MLSVRKALLDVYSRLEAAYDIDRWHWNPNTPALDVCLGCILVQHTSWTNVEKALARLRDADACSLDALTRLSEEQIAALVRPAGTPAVKAQRLKAFVALVHEHGGSLESVFALPLENLRQALLSTSGIGPETADAVLLYAARVPVFVHDAYTQRLMTRLALRSPARAPYADWQRWLESSVPRDLRLYQRFHAAIVVHCKERCRVRPRCFDCPLLDLCPFGRANVEAGGGR